MANYSEHYNLRLEAVGTQEVIKQLQAIDQMAERLERDGVDLRVDVDGLAKAQSQIKSLSTQAEKLERDGIDLKIDVDGYAKAMTEIKGISTAQARAIKAGQNETRNQVSLERQKIGVLNDQFKLYNNLSSATKGLGDRIQSGLKGINQFSNSMVDMLSKVQRLTGGMALVGGIGAGAVGVGIASQVKGAMNYAMEVDKAKQQLKAQGVEGKKLDSVYQDIVKYANVSPFDVGNMTEAVSKMNAFMGDIDKALPATKAFSESIFASGGNVEDLGNVAYNLGQISTNQFTKVDYKELLKNVPAMSQALRDYSGEVELLDINTGKLVKKKINKGDLKSWEQFNQLLGDDPSTQAIERKYDALDFLTKAIVHNNDKTHALETANEALGNKMENLKGQYQTTRHEALESSGAYKAFGGVIDTLGDKLKDPAVKKALTDMFKSITPLIEKAKQQIKDFNIDAFVTGLKDGAKDVINTFKGIIDNPVVKTFGSMLGKAIGAQGNVGDIGRGIGKLLSVGIKGYLGSTAFKLGFTALSKGSALVNAGIHASKALSGMFSKAKIPASFATEAGEALGGSVGGKLQTPGFGKAFSGALGKFLKGAMQLGGGVAVAGIGIGVGAWASSQGMKAIVETAKKLTDAVNYIADNLPNANSDKAYQMVAKLHLLDKMAGIVSNAGLGGGMKASISSAITNVAAIASGFGMATGNLTMAGVGLMVQGVRLLGAYIDQISAQTEGIKIENVGKLADLPKKFASIPANFDPNTVASKIKIIQDTVSKVHEALGVRTPQGSYTATSDLGQLLTEIDQAIPESTTSRVSKSFTNLTNLANTFASFGNIQDVGNQVVKGLNNLHSTINKIVNSNVFTSQLHAMGPQLSGTDMIAGGGFAKDTTMGGQLGQLEAQLKTVTSKIQSMLPKIQLLSDLSAKLSAIPDINPGAINKKMTDIHTTVTQITGIWGGAKGISGDGRSGGGSIGTVDFSAILEIIRGGIKVGAEVSKLGSMSIPNATPKINNMKSTINALTGLNGGGGGLDGLVSKLQDTGSKITDFGNKAGGAGVSGTDKLRSALNQLGSSSTTNGSKITALGTVITNFASKASNGTSRADSLRSALNNLGGSASNAGGKISGLSSKLSSLSSSAGRARSAVDSLKSALSNLGGSASDSGGKISSLSSKLGSLSTSAGKTKSSVDSLKSTVGSLGGSASSADGKVSGLSDKLGGLSSSAGRAKSSVDSLKSALSNLPSSKTITIDLNDHASSGISNIQTALNGVHSKTVDVTTNYKESGKKPKAVGGVIGYSTGGYVSTMFKKAMRTMSMGQDTVNAVLARGEAVIRRSTTAMVGKTFIDHLNSGNLQQAYDTLGTRMSTMYNNRYDNRSFNNQAVINQHFYGGQTNGDKYLKQYIKGVN